MPLSEEHPIAPLTGEDDWARAFNYHAYNVEIARTDGVFIYDTEGRRYYDASGGPMAQNLPHNHPRMKAAIVEQLDKYAYAHPTLANRKRAELCDAIASVTPPGLNTSYLVSGGSEAVETAIKIARQHQVACGRPGKHKIISNYESYHGMTLATMALSGNPQSLRHYDAMVQQWPKVSQYSEARRPADVSPDDWARKTAADLERTILLEGAHTIAAYIATPHGSGPDYGQVAPKVYWQEVRRICDENDVLLIADEVVSGFGRTGRWFAMEHHEVLPDIMTVAKGIGGNYMPLGAAIVSDKVNEPFQAGTGFVHGFTNGGHPLACAAGIAAIDILREEKLVERAATRGQQLFSHAERLRAHPSVADVRGWGLFMVLELVSGGAGRSYFPPEANAEQKFQQIALSNGLVFYSTLYGPRRGAAVQRGLPMWVSPPLSIAEDELEDLIDRLDRTLHHWEQAMGADA